MAQVAEPPAESTPAPEHVGKWTPPREAVVAVLRRRLEGRLQDVEGGPWDGVRVVTAKDLGEALAEELPPASLFVAEVRTPGWVTVSAVCPRCAIPTDVSVSITSQLVSEIGGSEIKLKAKSKGRSHVCGQTRIDEAADGDQGSFELTDIIGDDAEPEDLGDVGDQAAHLDGDEDVPRETLAAEPEDDVLAESGLDLGGCPFPGCILAAEHEGRHSIPPPAPDVDDDLLPL